MKKLFFLLLQVQVVVSFAQDWPVKSQVTDKKARNVSFVQPPSFSFVADRAMAQGGTYGELRLHPQFQTQVLQTAPEVLRIDLPLSATERITLELVQFSLGNIKFTENNDELLNQMVTPITYRGIVSGERQKHNVMLTVNKDYVSLLATLPDRVLQVTKADEKDASTYRLYNSRKTRFPQPPPFDCGTRKNVSRTPEGIDLTGVRQASSTAVQDKCVNVFVDCFDSLYQWQGSNRQQTVNYVTELFAQVATGFYNDSINILVAGVNIWTTADPYRGDSRNNALADLAANYQDNFWGNICVGLDFSINSPVGRSGLAGAIGRAKAMAPSTCGAYTAADHQFSYNDMNYGVTVQNFPTGPSTTQPQVYLVLHEMGHQLGANHTKWCGWKLSSNPDVFGTLDSCGTIEGSCAQGPPPPATGATIMSYCVTGNSANDFVNFNNGFGTLPGTAIRNFVNNTTCIGTCLDCIGVLQKKQGDWAYYGGMPQRFPSPSAPARGLPADLVLPDRQLPFTGR